MSLPIPQPPAIPLLGNIFDVNADDSIASLSHLAGKYGVHWQGQAECCLFSNLAQDQSSNCPSLARNGSLSPATSYSTKFVMRNAS
jgi:hypothetical protein